MARILIGNIKGPQGERGPQGIQGPVGPVGPQGPLPPLINNGLTTEAGKAALDAAYGKTITDRLTELNSDISGISGKNVFFGTYVYNGEKTRGITIQDDRVKNNQYKIIACCQDIGSSVTNIDTLKAGSFKVWLEVETTIARINYVGFELFA